MEGIPVKKNQSHVFGVANAYSGSLKKETALGFVGNTIPLRLK